MTRFVLGVIGHVDHGKTALVRALTGQDTDRLAEEKRRGISIVLGFAQLEIASDTSVDLIDVPGHERFVSTMISGATGMDAVLLVVAASEGVKPQTVEHVDIARLLGLRRALVAISKIDLVSHQQAARVADDAMLLLARSTLDAPPPLMISVPQNKGLEELRLALQAASANQRPRPADGLLFLPIDRAFSIAGHGPVVTGTLRGASVTAGDTLELLPIRRSVRVRAVQIHGETVAHALPGQRVALNLRDIEIAELRRGMALAAPDTLTLTDWLTICVRSLHGAPPLKNGMRLRSILGTAEFDARLRLLDRDVLDAGQSGFAQLHCEQPIAAPSGEHLILRLTSPPRTVGGGKVLQPAAQRQRRNSPPILRRLEQLRTLPPAQMIAAEVQRAGLAGTNLQQLSQLAALATPRIVELLQKLPVVLVQSGMVVWKADFDQLLSHIPLLLAPHADGLTRESLLSALTATATLVLDEALARLRTCRAISERGGQFLVPRPDEDRARARHEAELAASIAERLRCAGLTPPNPSAIVTNLQQKRAVDRLLRQGVVVRALDRAKGKEMLFHRDAIEDAQRRLSPLLERAPGLLVTEIGAALGISRRYSMPLLDHLDTIRFTRRVNDRRIRAEA